MKINDKVRLIRELRNWSQENMAQKLGMSTNGYAKLERGETRLNIPRLEQIAKLLQIDLNELLSIDERSVICLVNENSQHSNNYYAAPQELTNEIKRLQLLLSHQEALIKQKDELLTQQRREIETLHLLIKSLQKNTED
mgnify:CR=1 FL=1